MRPRPRGDADHRGGARLARSGTGAAAVAPTGSITVPGEGRRETPGALRRPVALPFVLLCAALAHRVALRGRSRPLANPDHGGHVVERDPGPGFPLDAPSVKISIISSKVRKIYE